VHALDFLAGVLLIPVTPGSPIQVADALSRALVPYGFLLGLLRLRIARGAVADLVVELSETPPPGRMRDALAGALGDPTLEIVYWSDDVEGYVDEHGLAVDLAQRAGGRAVTLLDREGRPLAAILHDPALAEDPGLVAAVGAAVRMAVDNERLTEEVRQQLDEVRASRARIVEAGDAERRRVERNLHDGAQQRLVALSLALRRASSQAGSSGDDRLNASLEDASQLVRDALAELRELARGIHPAVLTESGLAGALRSLATGSPVEVELAKVPDERFPPDVEATAYFFVSEALSNVAKHAPAARATVTIERTGDILTVEVADDGPGGAQPSAGSGLLGLDDRVAAAGGRFALASPVGHGTRLRAELPVAHGPAAVAQAPTVS
jgi:signal transduction histidine kinase